MFVFQVVKQQGRVILCTFCCKNKLYKTTIYICLIDFKEANASINSKVLMTMY